jgi:hypothetical protein
LFGKSFLSVLRSPVFHKPLVSFFLFFAISCSPFALTKNGLYNKPQYSNE